MFNELGAGYHERYYQKALSEAFSKNKLKFSQQVSFPLKYQDKIIGRNFLDFLVDDKIVVEIKKGERFSKKNIDQVMEYLNISDLKLAILINFTNYGVASKRIINFNS